MASVAGAAQAARYESLVRLTGAIRSRTGADDLFGLLVDEIRRTLPFDAIAQFDDTSTRINWRNEGASGEPFPLEIANETQSVASWVHDNQLSLVIPDVGDETRFRPSMQRLQVAGLRSVCGFPLSTARRQLGSIVMASRLVGAYGPEDVGFLSLAAGQIALAMDPARHFRESQRAVGCAVSNQACSPRVTKRRARPTAVRRSRDRAVTRRRPRSASRAGCLPTPRAGASGDQGSTRSDS
jgi:hypothetical protein